MIGMSWGAEDLGAVVGSLANRDASGQFTSPYRLVRDLCLITAAAVLSYVVLASFLIRYFNLTR